MLNANRSQPFLAFYKTPHQGTARRWGEASVQAYTKVIGVLVVISFRDMKDGEVGISSSYDRNWSCGIFPYDQDGQQSGEVII